MYLLPTKKFHFFNSDLNLWDFTMLVIVSKLKKIERKEDIFLKKKDLEDPLTSVAY